MHTHLASQLFAMAMGLAGKGRVMASRQRSKRLDTRQLESLASIVRRIVDDVYDGNGTAFAKALGVSQSHVSQILRGGRGDRGVGLPVLIAIRDYLHAHGQPMTLDQMLALEPVGTDTEVGREVQQLRAAVQSLAERLQAREESPPPSPPVQIKVLPARRRKES